MDSCLRRNDNWRRSQGCKCGYSIVRLGVVVNGLDIDLVRHSWEWDALADVLFAGDPSDGAFEAGRARGGVLVGAVVRLLPAGVRRHGWRVHVEEAALENPGARPLRQRDLASDIQRHI